ncbi:M20/M25/M40 family metallo-hydrolase [candidate division KSB1 bacterium]
MKAIRMCMMYAMCCMLFASPLLSQEPVYWDVVQNIRDEGLNRSQVMETLWYMTEVIGPRLTASPSMRRAQSWAKEKMESTGLRNVVIEDAGEHGVNWDNDYISVHMLEPDYLPVIAYALAYAPGTRGKITPGAAIVDIYSEADFMQYRGQLRGKAVLMSPISPVEFEFTPDARRFTDEELKALERSDISARQAPRMVNISREEYARLRSGEQPPEPVSRERINEFLKSEGVSVILNCGTGRGDDGTVLVGSRSGSRGDRSYEGVVNAIPEIVVATEHYNRIYRIVEHGIPVTLEVEVRNTVDNSDPRYYNLIGEIPGTDLRDQIVIMGGHYDSWHGGTGAVDNAGGCAVALEAARILMAIGVQPRRTIRVAFWTYEEGGLNGSREYVAKHFGNPVDGKKPDYDKLAGYFNMDNGTGQFRGVWLQGNELVKPIFEAWMKPLNDLGVTTLTLRNTSGTDHLSFDRAGLPGWQFIQDPIDYRPNRHHTNMDVYDALSPEDIMINSVVMATFAYHTAMRDELLPRKPVRMPERR